MHRIPAAALLLLLCLSARAQEPTALERRVQQLWEKGNRYDARGDHENAFACYASVSALVEQLDSTSFHYVDIHTRIVEYIIPLGLRQQAIHRLRKAIGILQRHHPEKKHNRMYLTGMLGGLYAGLQQYDSALVCMQQNLVLARTIDSGSEESQLNNIGLIYVQSGRPAPARRYFAEALALLERERNPDRNLLYSVNDNLGELEMESGRYDAALRYFTACSDLLRYLRQMPGRHVQARLQLGRIYTQMGRTADAERELRAAVRLLPLLDRESRIGYALRINDALSGLFRRLGNYDKAWHYDNRSAIVRDSLSEVGTRRREGMLSFLVSEQLSEVSTRLQLELEKSRRKEQELKVSNQKRRFGFMLAFVIGVCSVVVIVAGMLYFRSRRRQSAIEAEALKVRGRLAEIELKASRLEQEELKSTLAHKKQDISDLALYVTNLRSLHETMLAKLGEIRRMDPSHQLSELRRMMTDIGNRLDLSQKSSLIHQNIEEVNQEFYDRLQRKHATLTRADWELCGLIRLNMDNKEIAALRNIEPESVKRSKNRLRKKLGLDPADDMQQYLKAI